MNDEYLGKVDSLDALISSNKAYRSIIVGTVNDLVMNKEKIIEAISTNKISLLIATTKKEDFELMVKTISPDSTNSPYIGGDFQAIGYSAIVGEGFSAPSTGIYDSTDKYKNKSELFFGICKLSLCKMSP